VKGKLSKSYEEFFGDIPTNTGWNS